MTAGRYPEIAGKIKSARLRKGLSQEIASQRVGMSRFHWIRLEQGLHRPTEHAAKIAEVLGIEERDLLGSDEDEEAAPMGDHTAMLAALAVALEPFHPRARQATAAGGRF